ncbi:lanthionine synthetase LanC family protein [Mesorhizobium sp. M0923]|uniref:lanthionine synthetase LanC family protein n=1 Tax=Mesorhizobium sp. M0923 TaxID=2957028 RepID=UPI00333C43D0
MGSVISAEQHSLSVTAIGPDLYAGSAGIALALGECASVTGSDSQRLTAIGGLNRSCARFDESPQASIGLYGGAVGVGFAARRLSKLGIISNQDGLLLRTYERIEAGLKQRYLLDITGGIAGTLLFLVTEWKDEPSSIVSSLIERCAEALCDAALWTEDKCAWSARDATGLEFMKPLGGYSHGAAGIAGALLNAYAVTGSQRLLDTARGALAYDDSLFVESEQNWRDARFDGGGPDVGQGAFPVAWCHGAGGIALSRVTAARVDHIRADRYLRAADIAYRTTKSFLDRILSLDRYDCTLCHGIAGLADILFICGPALQGRAYDGRDVQEYIDKRLSSGVRLPSGLPSGRYHPSLFLGEAGIAIQVLRLGRNGETPSVLDICAA